jgi:hypothetical protein
MKKLILILLAILIFQSFGTGLLKVNFEQEQSFTQNFVQFWTPRFITHEWTTILNYAYSFVYLGILFYFIRRVEVFSWQFVLTVIVCVVFSYGLCISQSHRFRDILMPIMILTACKK